MKRFLETVGYSMGLSVRTQICHPFHVVGWFIANPAQYMVGIWIIVMVVQKGNDLVGWSRADIIVLYGLALISHGLMVTLFIHTWNVDRLIERGGFDRMLLRPISVFAQFTLCYFNLIGIADLIPGIIIFTYGIHLTGIAWNWWNAFSVIEIVLGATLIRAAIFITVASHSFWIKKSKSLTELALMTMQRATSYPLTIYPMMLQMFLTYVVPLGFIAYYPACDLLGKRPEMEFGTITPILGLTVGAICFTAAWSYFMLGLKRYESSGS